MLSSTRRHAMLLYRSERKEGTIPRAYLHQLMREWGKESLSIVGVQWEILGNDGTLETPAIVVGNHISYLDIPLLMTQIPLSFVAKKQVSKWPIFGHGCRSVGTVFVERESSTSRRLAAEAIGPHILREKRSVAVFPSGTTTLDEGKPWRWGAFLIAKRHGIPIRPFRIRYHPLRRAAFINNDLFPSHLWKLLQEGGVRATLEFHPLVMVDDPVADALKWWSWSREGLAEENTGA